MTCEKRDRSHTVAVIVCVSWAGHGGGEPTDNLQAINSLLTAHTICSIRFISTISPGKWIIYVVDGACKKYIATIRNTM